MITAAGTTTTNAPVPRNSMWNSGNWPIPDATSRYDSLDVSFLQERQRLMVAKDSLGKAANVQAAISTSTATLTVDSYSRPLRCHLNFMTTQYAEAWQECLGGAGRQGLFH